MGWVGNINRRRNNVDKKVVLIISTRTNVSGGILTNLKHRRNTMLKSYSTCEVCQGDLIYNDKVEAPVCEKCGRVY